MASLRQAVSALSLFRARLKYSDATGRSQLPDDGGERVEVGVDDLDARDVVRGRQVDDDRVDAELDWRAWTALALSLKTWISGSGLMTVSIAV